MRDQNVADDPTLTLRPRGETTLFQAVRGCTVMKSKWARLGRIAAGQRWAHALEDAATRCEAVLFLVSEDWLASKWCGDEYQLANKLNKKLFALLKPIRPLIWYRLYRGEFAGWIALA